jgi:hypothetical protein
MGDLLELPELVTLSMGQARCLSVLQQVKVYVSGALSPSETRTHNFGWPSILVVALQNKRRMRFEPAILESQRLGRVGFSLFIH